MRRRWLGLGLLLAACGGTAPEETPPAAAVATWSGGAIGLAELEEGLAAARTPACLGLRRSPGGGSLEQLIPCYREVAESLALEDLVLAELDEDLDRAVAGLEDHEQLRRRAFLAVHLERLNEEIEIPQAEVEAHFEANRDRYRRPARLRLWNIFRRHEEGGDPEETIALLRRVKERYEAGETFDALAREVSHSETRARGGLVGDLSKGVLPASLEKVAFGLADGEVSEPIRVKGGAVLLHVRNLVEEVPLSLRQVESRIRSELSERALRERIAAETRGVEPPPGATILTFEELLEALDGGDPERVVLEIAGEPVTVAGFRRMSGLGRGAAAAELPEESLARLEEGYRASRDRQLLMLRLPDAASPRLRREAEERLRRLGIARLVDDRLREEMWSLVDAEPDTLREYWEDNRHHYQTPLRFRVKIWDQPFGDEPPQQLWRMERLRGSLAAGELDLEAAAARRGGSVRDLGWKEYAAMEEELTPAARAHLLETGDNGFTAPYHQDDALHLIWVERREEPRLQEYEEAREQVRQDYLARFQQQLYRRSLEARLAAAGFTFDEAAVRRALAPPDTVQPGEST